MPAAASGALAVTKVLDGLAREDRGRLLSALIARLRDFSLAEDALQDAMIAAVAEWSQTNMPASPKGWLLQVAHRKAIDRIRQRKSQATIAANLVPLAGDEADDGELEKEPGVIPDERLRLIFTCCHPAIEPKSQIALTLRTLGGLSTAEIARAFLDQEATMGQRLSRAKTKIAAARIPYAVPGPEDWPQRLQAVLSVVYLIFNAGYGMDAADDRDLAGEAIWLGRMLNNLRPGDPEIQGFLALMLLTHARRAARFDGNGVTIALASQNRTLWDRALIEEGVKLTEHALAQRRPGPYQLKAAISACHCEGAASDWPQIAALYDLLLALEPTDVVRLNRAVACAEAGALSEGLAEIEALNPALADYQPYYAARAEMMARSGRMSDAKAAYARAIALAHTKADVAFLERRRDALSG